MKKQSTSKKREVDLEDNEDFDQQNQDIETGRSQFKNIPLSAAVIRQSSAAKSPGKKRGADANGMIAHEDIEFDLVESHEEEEEEDSQNGARPTLTPLKNKQPAVKHETPMDNNYSEDQESGFGDEDDSRDGHGASEEQSQFTEENDIVKPAQNYNNSITTELKKEPLPLAVKQF